MLGDYEKQSDFADVPDGTYIVRIHDAKGEISKDGKCVCKVQFKIDSGDFKGSILFKDYYLTAKTLEKFIPWQFGILGIWQEIKTCQNFDDGLQKSVGMLIDLANKNTLLSVDSTTEKSVYEGKEYTRANVKINDMVSGAVDDFTASKQQTESPTPQFDSNEEIPF